MRLNRVTIDNFRNIKHASYDLEKQNIFTGPNKTGKSNSVLAIYWVLSDYLIDGSSDFASFKPAENLSAEVSVELEFEHFKIKKVFTENWVKTRGTGNVTMQGHITDYYIDDVKTSVTEAKAKLKEYLGVDLKLKTSKFDLLRAIIDPYYIGSQCEWKTLRGFIIELIGDVLPEDIFSEDPSLNMIKAELIHEKYDTDKIQLRNKQKLTKLKQTIAEQEGSIKGLEQIKDVNASKIDKTRKEIERIEVELAGLRNQKVSRVNPKVKELENEIAEIQMNFTMSKANDTKDLVEMNRTTDEEIENLQSVLNEQNQTLSDLSAQIREKDRELYKKESESESMKRQLDQWKKTVENNRSKWVSLTEEEYPHQEQEILCPHCGGIVNEETLQSSKQAWIEKKQGQLDQLVSESKRMNLDIENMELKLNDFEKTMDPLKRFLVTIKEHADSLNQSILNKQDRLIQLRSEQKKSYISDLTKQLMEQLNEKQNELLKERNRNFTEDIDQAILELNLKKEGLQEIINEHGAYEVAQKKIREISRQLEANQEEMTEIEQDLILLEQYTKTRLNLFRKNVSSVFGDSIHFTLIEKNIKEGSWKEVCYPSVLNSETPYLNGSGSEQIKAGIYMSECIKKKLGLPDLPYLFDECDKLDSANLSAIETESQLITTSVDDIHYNELTLVTK